MERRDLYLDALRRTVETWRHGTFNRWEAVAFMATIIGVHMRELAEKGEANLEVRDAGAVPSLGLSEPLSADDQALQELYAEATAFWTAGFGELRLIK